MKTIEEYPARRNPLNSQSSTSHSEVTKILAASEDVSSPTSVTLPVQQMGIRPNIHIQCWKLYSTGNYDGAILNTTSIALVAVREKSKASEDVFIANLIANVFIPEYPLLFHIRVKAEPRENNGSVT